MRVIIFWIIYWIAFWWLLSVIQRWIRARTEKTEKISEEDKERYLNTKFPKRFSYYYAALIIVFILIIIGGSFFAGAGFPRLQKQLFNVTDSLLFVPTSISWFIFYISGLFLFATIAGLTLTIITHKFPQFELYCNVKSMGQGWPYMTYQSSLRFMLKFLFITLGICLPLILYAVFSYSYITKNGVYTNSKFFSLKEEFYPWEKVKKVKISCHFESRGRSDLRLGYILTLANEEKIDLWNTKDFLEKIGEINGILVSKNVLFEIDPIDNRILKELKRQFSGKGLEAVKKILRIDKQIALGA